MTADDVVTELTDTAEITGAWAKVENVKLAELAAFPAELEELTA
jgi:hypothetical protein